ncbi:MAG TPA: hypothetical protein VH590_01550 [Ktedonobacterales bacterium]|jgi:hypothetical protein
MVILIIVALLILFDIAAYVGGADSRDDTFSPEWKGRQNGFGAGGQY